MAPGSLAAGAVSSGAAGGTARSAVAPALFGAAFLAVTLSSYPVARLALLPLSAAAVVAFLAQPAELRRSRRLAVPLVLFVGWAVVSYLWTFDPTTTAQEGLSLVLLSWLGWFSGSLVDRRRLCRAASVVARLLLAVTLVSVVVAPAWATAPALDDAPGWHGPFDHKNGLGGFLVLAFLTLWYERPRTPLRGAWLAVGGILLVGCQSTTALALTLVAVSVGGWLSTWTSATSIRNRALFATFSASGALLGIALILLNFPLVASLFGRDPTLTGRTSIWSAVWSAIQDHPFEGHGYAGVWLADSEVTRAITAAIRFRAYHAHSGVLDLLLQVGAVGLVLFALLLGAAIARGVSLVRRRADPSARWGLVILVVLLVGSISESGYFFGGSFFLLVVLGTSFLQHSPAPDPGSEPEVPAAAEAAVPLPTPDGLDPWRSPRARARSPQPA